MPMIHVRLPREDDRTLVFYLAMEEYLAANLPSITGGEDAFFLWRVPPTVIFGRNQVMEAEVNIPYCRENGVRLFRRKSGGGCVYSDWGNVMVSYVSHSALEDVATTFSRYISRMTATLRDMGLDASESGRNDILVGGRKVSGNAFFKTPEASIVHGTMLFDSDFAQMQKTITPSEGKILSKGVESVRQRVTNVSEELRLVGNPMDIEAFMAKIYASFCEGEITLTPSQVLGIEEIEKTYLDPAFLEGRHHGFTLLRSGRVEGAGDITVELTMERDRIASCTLKGDFMPLEDGLDELLGKALKGCPDDREAVAAALKEIDLRKYVLNLGTEDFLDLAFTNKTASEQYGRKNHLPV